MSTGPSQLTPESTPRVILWLRCLVLADAPNAFKRDFVKMTQTRIEVAGAELLAHIGQTWVCAWDAIDADDAIEFYVELHEEVSRKSLPVTLCAGITEGDLSAVAGRGSQAVAYVGDAVDRAQILANSAPPGQLVVEDAVQEQAGELYLFAGELSAAGLHGVLLDENHPRKHDCRPNLNQLGQISLADTRPGHYQALREHCGDAGSSHIVIRADQPYDVLDWLGRLRRELSPAFVLHLRRQGGALQPLGSLQAALAWIDLEGPESPSAHLPANARETLRRIGLGKAVSRGDAVIAVTGLLAPPQGRAWVVADRLHDIDPATLGVLAECISGRPGGPLMFVSAPLDASIPPALAPEGARFEVNIRAPERAEREALAAAVLKTPVDSTLARRVAGLGEGTSLGVIEACRTLVTSGDLIPDGDSFRWRTLPRAGNGAVPVDALLSEQLAGLSPRAHRMLEALCLSPPCARLDFVAAVAQRDGLSDHDTESSLTQLQQEGWIDGDGALGHRHQALRSAVRGAMPPARSAELHRFVAATWLERSQAAGHSLGFGRALLAHHWSEGGQQQQASEALLDAAEQAVECGFQRMGVRLAATAVQLCGEDSVRARARSLVRRVDEPRPTRGSTPASSIPPQTRAGVTDRGSRPAKAVRAACQAILAREPEPVERLLDTAVAAGWGRAAAQRVWAVAQMSRGELEGAMRTLQQAHVRDGSDGVRAREAVTWALVQLQGGDTMAAVRSALSALAIARGAQDEAGEAAARAVLSGCYRALGDQATAQMLDPAP